MNTFNCADKINSENNHSIREMALRSLSLLEEREERLKSLSIRVIELVGKTNEKYGDGDDEVKELLIFTNELYSLVFQQLDLRPLHNLVQSQNVETNQRSYSISNQNLRSSQINESPSDDSNPSSPINSNAYNAPNTMRLSHSWSQDFDGKIIEIKDSPKQESTQPIKAAFFPPRDFRKKKTRKQRAKAAPETTELFCRSCGETKTCEWRRGPDGYKSLCNACGIHYAKIVKREESQMQSYIPKGPIKMDQLINNSSSSNQGDGPSSDAANYRSPPPPFLSPSVITPIVNSAPLVRNLSKDGGNTFVFPAAPSINYISPTKPPLN